MICKINLEGKFKRKAMMQDGAYDGRFSSKVIQDKKKKASKEFCKSFKY